MSLQAFATWTAIGWSVVAGTMILVYVAAEWFSQPHTSRHERLRQLARMLPLVTTVVVLVWPLLLVALAVVIRREWWGSYLRRPDPLGTLRPLRPGEWQSGSDPVRLLRGLSHRVSPRQQRLFAVACCERFLVHIEEPRFCTALDNAKRLLASPHLLAKDLALAEPTEMMQQAIRDNQFRRAALARAATECIHGDGPLVALYLQVALRRGRWAERQAQLALLRDILGDPYTPRRSRVFPLEIVELARACEAGDRALFPLLADALEELNEPAAAEHCRQGEHVPGCHVLEWVLGRE